MPLLAGLRAAGLRGENAHVRIRGDKLVITGDEAGGIEIAPHDVDRIRINTYSSRARPIPHYDTRIWLRGVWKPLAFAPPRHRHGTYGPVMREFAGWVFADGGKVIRGPGLFGLVVQTVLTIGIPSLVTLALLGEALESGQIAIWIVTVFCAGLTLLLFNALYLSQGPRRVTRPEQLDEFLPAREEKR